MNETRESNPFSTESENLKISFLAEKISPQEFLNQLFELDQSADNRDHAEPNLIVLLDLKVREVFEKR